MACDGDRSPIASESGVITILHGWQMGMNKFQPPTWTRPLTGPSARGDPGEITRRGILALRVEAEISRRVFIQRTDLHWNVLPRPSPKIAVFGLGCRTSLLMACCQGSDAT
jgi:hypothetical protein